MLRGVAGAALAVGLALPLAAAAQPPAAAEPVPAEALISAGDYAARGDRLTAEGRVDEAAQAYMRALSLDRGAFSTAERLRMAERIGWADELGSAIREIGAVLAEEPDNLEARLQLARLLSWNGELLSAQREAEAVLAARPDDQNAQRTRAESLWWQGDYAAALPLLGALAETGSFEDRVGLARALLDSGDLERAREVREGLRPADDAQQRSAASLDAAIADLGARQVSVGTRYYDDTDDNTRYELGAEGRVLAGNLGLSLVADSGRVEDPSRRHRYLRLGIDLDAPLRPGLELDLGAGVTRLDTGDDRSVATGHARISARTGPTGVQAELSHYALTDTAQIVENEIRVTQAGLGVEHQFSDRFTPLARYTYRDYSDDNHAHLVSVTLPYVLRFRAPRVSVGLRHEHLEFARQSGGGYFDPSRLVTTHGLLRLQYNAPRFSGSLDAFVGNQEVRRFGGTNNELVSGVYGVATYRVTPGLAVDFHAEGGDSGLYSSSGFRYYLVGLSLRYSF